MIRKVLPLLAAIAFAASAHAQLGVYGSVTLNNLTGQSGSPAAPASYTAGSQAFPLTYQGVNPIGGTGGIYYDFKSFGPVRIGADVRGVVTNAKRGAETQFQGTGVHIGSILGGARFVFSVPIVPLRAYLEPAVGLGRSDFGIQSQRVNSLEYHLFAGADLKVLPVLDWRVVELGYGGLDSLGTNSHNYPLKSISTGLVLHLPSL
jgi:hypothetical protein